MSRRQMTDLPVLQAALTFTDADLKANNEGYLSNKQRAQLVARQKSSLHLLTYLTTFIAMMIIGAVLLGNFGIIVLGVMALILAVMASVEYVIGYQTYKRDLSSNHVQTIQGVVHYIWRGDSVMGIETHPAGIRIGDMKFLLVEDQARAFVDGEIYALHYAPATHTLLSAEHIPLRNEADIQDENIAYWDVSQNDVATSPSASQKETR